MKKISYSLFFLFLGLVFFSNPLEAKQVDNVAPPTAKLMDNGAIILDKEAPLATSYEADVSHYSYNISSQAEGQAFLEKLFKKDHVSLNFDYSTMKITITLDQTASRGTWSIADWNNHLKQ